MGKPLNPSPVSIKDDGCWIWNGPLDAYGHPIATGGYFPGDPSKVPGRTYRVRQVAFERANGYKAKVVGSTCRQPLCINPSHLIDKQKARAEAILLNQRVNIKQTLEQKTLILQGLEHLEDPAAVEYREKLKKEVKELKGVLEAYESGTTNDSTKDGETKAGAEGENPQGQ